MTGGMSGRWRRLTWSQRRQLAGCVIGIGMVHAGLLLFGYTRVRRWTERCTRTAPPRRADEADVARAQALARLAAIAGHRVFGDATCLRRALLLYGWLRRRGLDPVLHLGVAEQPSGPFRAHAWVELEGMPLLQSDAGHRPFARGSGPSGEP